MLVFALISSLTLAAAPASTDLDFDLLAPSPAPVAAVRDPLQPKAERRRTMLRAHQIVGLSTLGVMAATVVVGQLNYSDLYSSGGSRHSRYLLPHRILAYSTTAGFAATASLSLFAPHTLSPAPARL